MQKPEEVVPLENILKVTSIDSATAEPYQFKIFTEGIRRKAPEVWTLKARSEVSITEYTVLQVLSISIVITSGSKVELGNSSTAWIRQAIP